ncbi:MAG: GGDEF domain-containing protein, partial [Treponemataceae bacterium]|nr:GGDEF domain-containing protein [Treponemataceae bacterium]
LIYSDDVALMQAHAMKLVALANNLDFSLLNEELQIFYIPENELKLSKEAKLEKAREYVYGPEYQELFRNVQKYQELAKKGIINFSKTNQLESSHTLSVAILCLQIFSGLLITMIAIMILITYFMLIKPLDKFVECIKNDQPLENVRSKELGYLAKTYNRISEIREDNNMYLKEKAERDALTKLYNRQVFQQNASMLSRRDIDLILILLDIDTFKHINDTYGHDIGDKIIIKSATLMRDYLGGDHDTYRVGGDEFVVFIRNKDTSYFEELKERIAEINEILQNPTDNLPPSSISAGIAYSESGYSQDLYNNADSALYNTKENGRCGSSFYEENLEEL